MNKKPLILLTGGSGFIGSHTAVSLIENGFDVLIADNLSNSYIQALDGIKKITGSKPLFELIDFTNLEDTLHLFSEYEFFAIIHFAAFKAVSESIQNPLKYYHNNLTSTLNLLKAIQKSDKNFYFIFSSSCTVYGTPNYLPLDEKHPFNPPTSPYGYTKQWSELIIKNIVERLNGKLKAISLRYFNPIGAHPSGYLGESPKIRYNVIPLLTEAAKNNKTFYIFGNDYPTPDGTAIRDYIYIMDLAEAHVIALKRLLDNKNKENYEFFNLGIGKGYSVLELVKTFEKVANKKINYKFAPRRPGDLPELYASTQLANKELNWKAKADLEYMLKTAWLWESKYKFY